ncbi:MAG: CehA/McbA family metallohydrolase [bacterium]
MRRYYPAVTVLAVLLLSGCGDSPPGGDSHDAQSQADSAIPVDAGAQDAASDAGLDPPDGGSDASADGDAGLDAAVTPDAGGDAGTGLPTGCFTGSFTPYFGNLHAHTSNSDGDGTPAEAFDWARYQGLLDIMVVTDHVEQLYTLWGTEDTDWTQCRQAADAADTPGTYVAMCGYEYGSGFSLSGSSGHANVFFVDYLFPWIQLDFQDFYLSMIACPDCVGQFNHPGDDPSQTWDDFAYNAAVDANMNLFEFNGGGPTWNLFFTALDNGWHLSPVYNQDNHSANWGTANDRRAGFYLPSLNRAAVHTAMQERRTFMTRDKNAAIRMLAESVCWMGSRLSGVSSIELEVEATDTDVGDGFDTIEIYGPGQALLQSTPCNGQLTCTATYTLPVASSTYVVARALQSDGDELVSAPIWAAP